MKLKCNVVEKISSKGNKYICLEVYLTDTYKKVVYLDAPEIELIKINNKDEFDDFDLIKDDYEIKGI